MHKFLNTFREPGLEKHPLGNENILAASYTLGNFG
jgi:hypothetical protein